MGNIVEKVIKKRFVLPAVLLLVPLNGLVQTPSAADCQAYANRILMDAGSVAGGMGRGALRGAAFGADYSAAIHVTDCSGSGQVGGVPVNRSCWNRACVSRQGARMA